jgi:hypothetical protein
VVPSMGTSHRGPAGPSGSNFAFSSDPRLQVPASILNPPSWGLGTHAPSPWPHKWCLHPRGHWHYVVFGCRCPVFRAQGLAWLPSAMKARAVRGVVEWGGKRHFMDWHRALLSLACRLVHMWEMNTHWCTLSWQEPTDFNLKY